MDHSVLQIARAAIDEAHKADPKGKELAYADSVEAMFSRWFDRQLTGGEQLAARCQHLERWVISRDEYPRTKSGYFKWRLAVHARQGDRAFEILTSAGVDEETATRIQLATAKKAPKDEWAQAMEDCACLVFLQEQALAFAGDNEYSPEKMIDILQKTWRKISPRGQELALKLEYPADVGNLIQQALG